MDPSSLFSISTQDLAEIVTRSQDDFKQLLTRDIFILGASGFVGSWLTESIVYARGEFGMENRVVLVNRNLTKEQKILESAGCVEIYLADLRESSPQISENSVVFSGANPARATLNIHNPRLMSDIILRGTLTLLSHVKGVNCRVINLSSGAVYGAMDQSQDCFTEADADRENRLLPESAYHRAKVDAENILNTQTSKENQVSHARLFAFLAPKLPLNEHFAAGNFLRDALDNRPIRVTGDGRTVRSYQYGTDLVCALFAIASRGEHRRAYNVGSQEPITILQLANKIATRFKVPVSLESRRDSADASNVDRYVPCTTRIENELGVKNNVGLDDLISRTADWHQHR